MVSVGLIGLVNEMVNIGNLIKTSADNNTPIKEYGKELLKKLNESDNINQLLDLTLYGNSLTAVASSYTIEPLIISTDLARESEEIEGAYHLATNVFTAFYVQVFNILTKINNIDPKIAITLLSSKLTGLDMLNTGRGIFRESDIDSLLSNKAICLNQDRISIGTEGNSNFLSEAKSSYDDKNITGNLYGTLLRDVEVSIDANNIKYKIPINVLGRLVSITADTLINICAPRSNDKSFWARLDEYRSGGITLSDFLFCSDLIKEYKTGRLGDKTDSIDKINSRSTSSLAKIALIGGKGYEANYNFYIVSHDDVATINKYIKGNILTNDKAKDNFLDQAKGMGVIVMDDDYQKASLLIKDIYGISTINYKQLANQTKTGKASTDNSSEILKALIANRTIGF